MHRTLVFLVMLAAAACGGTPPSTPAGTPGPSNAPAGTARVKGVVHFTGTAPEPGLIRLDGDPTCVELNNGSTRPAAAIITGAGDTLGNVFVYVKAGLDGRTFPVPTEPVVIDQQRCEYVPHVLGIQVGQPLVIRNSDPLLHNIRADAEVNRPFNLGQPVKGMEMTRVFATSEVMVPLKCDVHGWMSAYIGVLNHPYFAVSDGSGAFSIANLPAGTYTLEAWHETLGTRTAEVTVTDGGAADVTFTFAMESATD